MPEPDAPNRSSTQFRVEVVMVPLVALLSFLTCLFYSGGPLTWDELLYMDLSWNLDRTDWISRKPWLFNRYWHIYSQALWMKLAGNPLLGAKVYWSLLLAATLSGTYVLARLLAKSHSLWVGVFALFLLLSMRIVFQFAGVTYAEFSLMPHLTWMAVLFLSIQRTKSETKRNGLLALFGVTLLLSFKSKEIAVGSIPLLAGFGFLPEASFSLRVWGRSLLPLSAGFLLGCLFLLTLDCLFVYEGVAWLFSRGIAPLPAIPRVYPETPVTLSILYLIGKGTFLFPTWLYIASFWILKSAGYRRQEGLVWVFPAGLLLTLVLRTYFLQREPDERFFIPLLPILCACAAQFFQFPQSGDEKSTTPVSYSGPLVLLSAAVPLAFDGLGGYERLAARGGWDPYDLHAVVTYPAGTLACLGIIALVRTWTPSWVFVFGAVFWLTLYPALQTNYETLTGRVAAQKSELRFRPLELFRDSIDPSENGRYFVSKSIEWNLGMFGRDTSTCSLLFNVYFGASSTETDFIFEEPEFLLDAHSEFQGVFLHANDLETLGKVWVGDLSTNRIQAPSGASFEVLRDLDEELVYLQNRS